MCYGGKQDLDVTWLLEHRKGKTQASQDSGLNEGFRMTGGKGDRRCLEREGAACLFSVGNNSVKSSLCFTPILHVGYGFGIWRCPWQSGSQFPPSFEATWMLNCHKVTLKNLILCVEKKTTLLDCSFNECVMLVGTRLVHEMKTDSERRLPPTAWLHCFQEQPGVSWETPIHLAEGGGKREQGRSLGKLSNCRNWSIWHTAGRNISETCSFQMNQRKIQNKTTQQRQGWDFFFFNIIYNAAMLGLAFPISPHSHSEPYLL